MHMKLQIPLSITYMFSFLPSELSYNLNISWSRFSLKLDGQCLLLITVGGTLNIMLTSCSTSVSCILSSPTLLQLSSKGFFGRSSSQSIRYLQIDKLKQEKRKRRKVCMSKEQRKSKKLISKSKKRSILPQILFSKGSYMKTISTKEFLFTSKKIEKDRRKSE